MRALLIVLMLAGCAPAYADDLDDAIKAGMRAYADSYPDYPDLPVGWMRVVIDGLQVNADKSATVTPLTIKAYVIGQSPNDHPHRAERAGTFANALHLWVSGLPEKTITGAELLDRFERAYDDLYPPPEIPVLPPNYPEGQP